MWSFGCVLTCLFTDHVSPYGPDVESTSTLLREVAAGSRQPKVPEAHPLFGFVRDCCKHDPTARASAAELAKQLRAAYERLDFLQRLPHSSPLSTWD